MKRMRLRLKLFVEACGRHPFATGLFALLGVIGLIFSFYAYRVDRAENAVDDAAQRAMQADLSGGISDLNSQIANLPGAEAEAPGFVPITAVFDPYAQTPDNVTFPASYMADAAAMAETLDYMDLLADLQDRNGSFSELWIMQFSVTSESDRNFVQVAPYIVFDVLDVREIPDGMATVYFGERGGGAEARTFYAKIPPAVGRYYAPLSDPYTGDFRTDIEYFVFEPREPEEFIVEFTTVPGYIYTVRAGLHYKYQNQHRIHWVTAPFRSGKPSRTLPVMDFSLSFADGPYPNVDHIVASEVEAGAAERLAFVSRGRVFNPRQLSGNGRGSTGS